MKKIILSLLVAATTVISSSCAMQPYTSENANSTTEVTETTQTEDMPEDVSKEVSVNSETENNENSSVSKIESSKEKDESNESSVADKQTESSEPFKTQESSKPTETKKNDSSKTETSQTSKKTPEKSKKETSKEESKTDSQVSSPEPHSRPKTSTPEESKETPVKPKTIQASSIKLSTHKITLYVGDTYSISAEISPSNVTDKSFTWHISNTNVFEVKNNVIHAKKAGDAMLTATTANGKKDICLIYVKDKPKTESSPAPKEESKTETTNVSSKTKLDKAYDSLYGGGVNPDLKTIEDSLRKIGEKNGLVWNNSFWCISYPDNSVGCGSEYDEGVYDTTDMHRQGVVSLTSGPSTYDWVDICDNPAQNFRNEIEKWVDNKTKLAYNSYTTKSNIPTEFKFVLVDYYDNWSNEKIGYTLMYLYYPH